ncbi:DUF3828 domain-containing protein [Flavobacterium undicola]|uniref:DUF3828 domain-containing protein n=1 Tax=Flavobacterium undicola TaxID=1932779 RepID=UPI001376C2CC|nr:DUF3828 domain-containing protein [Flavobacterium undicola]MBA0883369.1 DUF3828 domain-containing protein [Flavobacterium undicola]
MNNKIFFCINLLVVLFLYSCKKEPLEPKRALKTEESNNSIENGEQIEKILTAFYTSYLEQFSNQNLKESEKKLDSIKVKYCTKSLLDGISNEFENNELDYDPFIKAQDASSDMIETLTVNKIAGSENKFHVQYLDKYSGHKTDILVTVVDENGSFKISSLK